jgi:hypothetical protein
LVISDLRVIGLVFEDQFDFLPIHVLVRGGLGFPQYLASYGKITPLLPGKIQSDPFTVGASEIVDAVRQVFSDIDFAIGIGDFENDFHTETK